jgi:predicted AlkP superfamily pyrophosphatase or phosphodiesterase
MSGEIAIVTRPGVVFSDSGSRYDHGSPWDYDAHVPLLLYGPGVARRGTIERPSRPQDLTATVALALGLPPPPAAGGHAWREALAADAHPGSTPRIVFIVVMDQVGYHHLAEQIAHVPHLARMIRHGAWFTGCRLDYLPSATGVSHATVGTGAVPGVHGIGSNTVPDGAGGMRSVWADGPDRVDPRVLLVPTLADWVDRFHANRSVIIGHVLAPYAVAGLVGHGSAFPGGDRDILSFYSPAGGRFVTDERYFSLPAYARDRKILKPGLAAKYAKLGLAKPFPKGAPVLPEFAAAEVDLLLEMLEREGVGTDSVPDLVLLNLKSTDYVGHQLGHDHPYYREALRQVDRFLGRSEDLARRVTGPGGYLYAITADHGACPVDGVRVDRHRWARELGSWLDGQGDRDSVSAIRGIEACLLYVDREELGQEGYTLAKLKDRILEDPRILSAWTADELTRRRLEMFEAGPAADAAAARVDAGCGPAAPVPRAAALADPIAR